MSIEDPIIRIGKYGLHVIKFPSGRYGFVGTVPVELDGKVFDNYEKAAWCARKWSIDNGYYYE